MARDSEEPGARYVAVEGLIGVGKTTLCQVLERERGARLFLEPAATNPFLEPFYADPGRYAFPVQMFYLYNRWLQQTQIRQGDLFTGLAVSDYLFDKDRLFAEKTLGTQELELYDRFAAALGEQAPTPDMVLYLEAPIPVIMQRIARRSAPGEAAISETYLRDLQLRYERLWAGWTGCPVLRVSNQDMNYADDPAAQRELLHLVDQALDRGPTRAAPGSARADREVQPSLFGTNHRRNPK